MSLRYDFLLRKGWKQVLGLHENEYLHLSFSSTDDCRIDVGFGVDERLCVS